MQEVENRRFEQRPLVGKLVLYLLKLSVGKEYRQLDMQNRHLKVKIKVCFFKRETSACMGQRMSTGLIVLFL